MTTGLFLMSFEMGKTVADPASPFFTMPQLRIGRQRNRKIQ